MENRFPDPEEQDNILHNPSFDQLREFSRNMETTTEFGSPSYVSEYRSRSADRTKDSITHEITDEDREQIRKAVDQLKTDEFVCIDRQLGRHPDNSYVCRYFVPKKYARIALSWAKLCEPATGDPDFYTLQIPEWDSETRIRAFPDDGMTFVLGSDYTGEAKMSFLRLWMYHAKQTGGLGLHAGSKRIMLEEDGELQTIGQLFLGLSATGKSTLTGHGLWLDEPEYAELLQDDIVALQPDGYAAGSEGGGLYIKTYGMTEEEQPELYNALTSPGAVIENVKVADDGSVDFFDDSITRNGRATILRDDLSSAADNIDLDRADQIFFITRNPLMPPIAKLSHEQAAAAFMLGESIQTSAGDPDKAGESIRVVGTNPFIIGSEGEEGNRFHDLVRKNGIDCFIINTGYLGNEAKQIGVDETITIIRNVARGTVTWKQDDRLGLRLPEQIPDLAIKDFYPPDHVGDFDKKYGSLKAERESYIAQFDDLKQMIQNAVY